jgi:hypothetical protein
VGVVMMVSNLANLIVEHGNALKARFEADQEVAKTLRALEQKIMRVIERDHIKLGGWTCENSPTRLLHLRPERRSPPRRLSVLPRAGRCWSACAPC